MKPLKDQNIVEGQNAEFTVETTNIKAKTVKWYKNGQEIKQDSRIVITEEENIYRLVIKTANQQDVGQYKVVLSNSAGDVDSSAKLTVTKAKPGSPRITKGLDDQVVAKGAQLVFEVKVQGEIDTVRWIKDGQVLDAAASQRIQMVKVDDQT